MGLPTEDPLNNCPSNASAFGPSKWGISIPPSDKASVSITAGPPAWVTIAIFLPFNSG